ncbi:MAG TPA: M20/M25/M40 family metallo-hydrolase [Candidatus Baltobacteraceae bacterium]|nr:M20/M25/M40 family metallo-hydrolase [Candidatus Baltobacteraceae bacterium]
MVRGLTADPAQAGDEALASLVGHLQALLRLRTVNPPGDEIVAARYVAGVLAGAGLTSRVLEPFPGRGDVVARLRGDGTGGGALLLLGHLDVVPADAERWTHDPFGGELAGGYLYGRGAVDMKNMVAMSLQVVLDLAAEATAAGLDPARDAVPGLRRDLIFAATADEEAGGLLGAGWLVDHEPDLLRAEACLTETGGVSVQVGTRRLYPIQVAEKGYHRLRITVRGAAGHAAMPRPDSATIRAARIVEQLAGPTPQRITPLMRRALERVAAAIPSTAPLVRRILAAGDAAGALAAIDELCREPERRALKALLRDTISPTIVHAGVKENVLPGTAEVVVDCRQLPGTTAAQVEALVAAQVEPDLWRHCSIEVLSHGEPLEQPLDRPLLALLGEVLRAHDAAAVPVALMAPFATDAKHMVRLGIPTYGFSPLRLDPDEPFLERFHGDDERVAVEALGWGYRVLADAVRRYCG